MPRKHLIAAGINKKQQTQAKIWMKLAKEIKTAAKVAGPNPDTNPRLKAAIDKALQNNLSRESIDKNIHGSNKDASSLIDLEYEGYGPNGLGIIIKALTDNENRTASAIRGYFSKLSDKKLAKQNSVKSTFRLLGEIIIDKNDLNEDKLTDIILEIVLDFETNNEEPVENIVENLDCFQVLTNTKYFYKVRDGLLNKGLKIIQSEIKYIPNEYVDLTQEEYAKLEKFLNQCSDDDDIQWVETNFGEIK